MFITVCGLPGSKNSSLEKYLQSNAQDMGGQFVKWDKLLEGIQQVKNKGGSGSRENNAEQIKAIGKKLQLETKSRSVIIMIDEVPGFSAPKDKDSEMAIYNWTFLEPTPMDVHFVLVFNPGLYHKRRLLLPESCLCIQLDTIYRSNRSIIKFHTAIAAALEQYVPRGAFGNEVVRPITKDGCAGRSWGG